MRTVIFLIDEKPAQLSMLREFFPAQYFLNVYQRGKPAFRAALQEKPNLILLDSQISDIDAHELCRLFKGNQALRKTRIVMLYPQSAAARCKRCYQFGADDYLLKPLLQHECSVRLRILLKTPQVSTPESFPFINPEGTGLAPFIPITPVMS